VINPVRPADAFGGTFPPPATAAGATDSPLLADHTTFRVGGPADRLVRAETEAELIAAVRQADRDHTPLLILAGGSNVLVGDDGFPGVVVLVATRGRSVAWPPAATTPGGLVSGGAVFDGSASLSAATSAAAASGGLVSGGAVFDRPTSPAPTTVPRPGAPVAAPPDAASVLVTVAAGEVLDDLVAWTVAQGWSGLEALSGVPGLVGAAPVQNVGAYGAELAAVVARVRVFDRRADRVRVLEAADCGFAYRDSDFKRRPDRHVILSLDLRLTPSNLSAPIRQAELARRLGVEPGATAPLAAVRRAVLELRRSKGMVLDPADHDTWSAGSFFTNPLLAPAQAAALPAAAPRYRQPDGRVKLSAAWLIEQAGFPKGYGDGPAGLSSRHVLALTNRGQARAADILALARTIRAQVADRFGVTLEPEPVLVNCQL
jgi:UDP-N-acetylmuramate dehydrogenase